MTARRGGRLSKTEAGRESKTKRRERTAEILDRLRPEYPDARTALDHENPFQLLVATILSAQCTDERVNQVTPVLFGRFPDARSLGAAPLAEIEEIIHSTGFFRNKARSLKGMSQAVASDYDGELPQTMDGLTALPGVGRKTANVILGSAFGVEEGIVVDTHVTRLSQRLYLSREKSAEKIEVDLMKLVPSGEWALWSHLLILHGRSICKARTPLCGECVLVDLCPSAEVAS